MTFFDTTPKLYNGTVVLPRVLGIRSETSSGCLKLQVVLNPIYTMFFLQIHTHDKV